MIGTAGAGMGFVSNKNVRNRTFFVRRRNGILLCRDAIMGSDSKRRNRDSHELS